MLLGVISAQLGALPQAIAHLQQATQLQPDAAPAWSNLGLALLHANQLQDAENCLQRAVALNPKDAGAHNTLGALYRQQGKVDAAIRSYQSAIKLQPRNADAHNNLGGILQEQCRADEAIAAYQRALKIAPGFAQAHYNLGSALHSNGQHAQALHHYQKALQLDPQLSSATAAIAAIQEKEGRFDEALTTLQPLLRGGQTPAPAAKLYAALAQRNGTPGEAIELLGSVLARSDLSNVERQELEYALGDLCDRSGEYDAAFMHYSNGNRIRPYAYDRTINEQRIDAIIAQYPAGSMPDTSATDYPPAILIVGMPRSSTSLVEQILASHPQVHGGGELPYIAELLTQYADKSAAPSATPYSGISESDIRTLGKRYLKLLRDLNSKARFVSDKMPHNFLHLGLIARALPNARIVHCQRNPLDTCLSIYFHNFNANHPYATDLAALGHYYRQYERLMAHWRSVLGKQLLDMPYTDIINDQEAATRRLLEHCGLEWNEDCLRYYASKRIVNTPSYDQVRQPIYTSSNERWRHYSKHLAPLIDALGDSAPPPSA